MRGRHRSPSVTPQIAGSPLDCAAREHSGPEEGTVTGIEGAWISSSGRVFVHRLHGFVQRLREGEW